MTSTIPFAPRIQADPALHIRAATEPLEISPLRAVLGAEHYLKAGRPAGHVLWQGVYQQDPEDRGDTLVAVLGWAGAAKRLKDRDTWIGWDAVTCAASRTPSNKSTPPAIPRTAATRCASC